MFYKLCAAVKGYEIDDINFKRARYMKQTFNKLSTGDSVSTINKSLHTRYFFLFLFLVLKDQVLQSAVKCKLFNYILYTLATHKEVVDIDV